MTVPITQAVSDGIEYVRAERYARLGHLNMLDAEDVAALAREGRFNAAASWIEQNEQAYAEGIIFGFEVAEDSFVSAPGDNSVASTSRANGD